VSPKRSLSAKRRSSGAAKTVDVLPDGTVVETKEVYQDFVIQNSLDFGFMWSLAYWKY